MVVLKHLVYIYCRKGEQLFSSVCAQLLFLPETVERNDEDIGPLTLELWPEVHLVHRKVQ